MSFGIRSPFLEHGPDERRGLAGAQGEHEGRPAAFAAGVDVGSRGLERFGRVSRFAGIEREHEGRPALLIGGVDVRSGGDQLFGDIGVFTEEGCVHQRRCAFFAARVHFGAVVQQTLHQRGIAGAGCQHQWRAAVAGSGVDAFAAAEQLFNAAGDGGGRRIVGDERFGRFFLHVLDQIRLCCAGECAEAAQQRGSEEKFQFHGIASVASVSLGQGDTDSMNPAGRGRIDQRLLRLIRI